MAQFYCLMDNIYFPEWAVCLHEYGDTEGLTDDGCGFIHHPAFGLACNCYKAKVWVFANER